MIVELGPDFTFQTADDVYVCGSEEALPDTTRRSPKESGTTHSGPPGRTREGRAAPEINPLDEREEAAPLRGVG